MEKVRLYNIDGISKILIVSKYRLSKILYTHEISPDAFLVSSGGLKEGHLYSEKTVERVKNILTEQVSKLFGGTDEHSE